MGEFFSWISENEKFKTLAPALDWFVSENKFSDRKWNTSLKRKLTKEIRGVLDIEERSFCLKTRKLSYSALKSRKHRKPTALFSGKSLSVDFIRHIRNGIAHGNITCYKTKRAHMIEIEDFYQGKQTAYIYIPLDVLNSVFEAYKKLNEST